MDFALSYYTEGNCVRDLRAELQKKKVPAMSVNRLRVGEVLVLRYDSAAVQENRRSDQKRKDFRK